MLRTIAFMLMLSLATSVRGQGPCPPEWSPPFAYDTALYPFENKCIDLGFGTMHYIDEQSATRPHATVLLLHGNPTWSFLYRDIAIVLLEHGYRIVAPDFYGFGLSDQPDPDVYGYEPHAHADTMTQFIDALDLRNVTLVGQDWSGPIGLALTARRPARVKSLVLMNTWGWNFDVENPGVYHGPVDFSLDNIKNEDRYIATGSMPRSVGVLLANFNAPPGTDVWRSIRDAYWGPFIDPTNGQPLSDDAIRPTNIFAQNLTLDRVFMEEVEASYTIAGTKPVYFLFGADDSFYGALRCDETRQPTCPPTLVCTDVNGDPHCLTPSGEKVFAGLLDFESRWMPNRIVGSERLEGVSHFIQELATDEIVHAIEAVSKFPMRAEAD